MRTKYVQIWKLSELQGADPLVYLVPCTETMVCRVDAVRPGRCPSGGLVRALVGNAHDHARHGIPSQQFRHGDAVQEITNPHGSIARRATQLDPLLSLKHIRYKGRFSWFVFAVKSMNAISGNFRKSSRSSLRTHTTAGANKND
jgi:hypothetical protein